jgi:hypothetical protein
VALISSAQEIFSGVSWGGGLCPADPADALRGLRQLLHRLESRQMSVNQGGTDVTTREIAVLRREIEQLKRTLSRLSR